MKMFKGCPENHRKECEGCHLVKQCVKKKIKRKALRFFHTHKKLFFMITIIIVAAISSIVIIEKSLKASREEATIVVKNTIDSANDEIVRSTEKVAIGIERVKATKKVEKETTKEVKPTEAPEKNSTLGISDIDIKNMEKIVYAEARGEPYEGQVAVAAVVLNRYEFYDRKQSITKLVTAPYQFADISNINQKMLDAYPDCKKAVQEALAGNDPTEQEFSEGARYFYDPDHVEGHQKEIREGIHVLRIGNHCFHNDFNE